MTIYRGGSDLERLYLEDLTFTMNGEEIVVKKTDIPGVDMPALIARHKGRYALCGLFLRPGMRMLDFPCGSGYGTQMAEAYGIIYMGCDSDLATVDYAWHVYNRHDTYPIQFCVMDLREPHLASSSYDLIACIEGIEHIERQYQAPLIEAFYKALKPGGVLIVSCPMAQKSGPNPDNPYHLCELSYGDFADMLCGQFVRTDNGRFDRILVDEVLSTGKKQTMIFGICHKE